MRGSTSHGQEEGAEDVLQADDAAGELEGCEYGCIVGEVGGRGGVEEGGEGDVAEESVEGGQDWETKRLVIEHIFRGLSQLFEKEMG